jgi:uncharacterized membrane protein YqaE (UPF0057 family)
VAFWLALIAFSIKLIAGVWLMNSLFSKSLLLNIIFCSFSSSFDSSTSSLFRVMLKLRESSEGECNSWV